MAKVEFVKYFNIFLLGQPVAISWICNYEMERKVQNFTHFQLLYHYFFKLTN